MKKDEDDRSQKVKTNVYRKQSNTKEMIIDIKTKIEIIILKLCLSSSFFQADVDNLFFKCYIKISAFQNMELEDALPDSKVDIKIFVSEQDPEWLMSSSLDSIPWYNTDYIINMGQHDGS